MSETIQGGIVIVGASHAGVHFSTSLRRLGWQGAITLLGDEIPTPYHRPPLSKAFLLGEKVLEQIQLRPASVYEKADITLELGTRVTHIDRASRIVDTADGRRFSYDKLILATGARARELPLLGADCQGVHYLRSTDDVERIRSQVKPGANAVIIGGGYIGLEAAATLRKLGMNVTVVEALDRVLQRVTSPTISAFFQRVHTEEGVRILTSTLIASIVGEQHVESVELSSGEKLPADLVIVGIGIVPNTDLAEAAGLAVDNGVITNEYCQTADPDIYAIGDCACTPHVFYEQALRVESVQNAHDQALCAAKAIVDAAEPYAALPWFWSDQFDVKLQIAGLIAGHDRIVVRGDALGSRKFAVFYLRGDKLLAVDAINSPKEFITSKQIISDRLSVDDKALADPDIAPKDCVV